MPPPSSTTDVVCAWGCGRTAVTTREIEPEQKTRDGDVVKRAITAPVCAEHSAAIDRNVRVAELRAQRKRVQARIGHPRYDQDGARAKLAEIDQELAELA